DPARHPAGDGLAAGGTRGASGSAGSSGSSATTPDQRNCARAATGQDQRNATGDLERGEVMNEWKQFCRAIESKVARRQFGNAVGMASRSAVFEMSGQQFVQAIKFEPETEAPVPPLPFPNMCIVKPGAVNLITSPVMD